MADNEKWWVKYGTIAAIALLPCGALSAELPPALKGVWTKQVSAATTNPNRVVLGGDAATIDGERCKLDSLRAIHSARWYADFTCSSTNRLWVDVSVLAEDRIMMNRRPLAEADIYVRGGSK